MKSLYSIDEKWRLCKLPWKIYADEDVRDSVRRIPFLRALIWQGYAAEDMSATFPVFDYRQINNYMGEHCINGDELIPFELIERILLTARKRGDLRRWRIQVRQAKAVIG